MANKELLIKIAADSREAVQALQKIDKSAENTSRVASRLDGAMKGALAAFTVDAVVGFGREMFSLAQTMEAAERRSETVFGAMADDARRWAEENDEAFGMGTTALLGLQAAVGDLLVPMGFAREEALGMSQDILHTANALSEWTGGTVDAAVAQDKITKAILGERDGLVELGVKISEADVQRRLAERGTDDLTGAALEQEKALITLTLIQEKGADALTAYAEGSNEAAKAAKELSSEWQNMRERIADNAEPILTGFVSGANDILDFFSAPLIPMREFSDLSKELGSDIGDLEGETDDYRDAAHRMASVLDNDVRPGVTIVRQETEGYTRTLKELRTETARQADPLYALVAATKDVEEAQQNYADVVAESGENSEEAREAALELAEAQGDLNIAAAELSKNGMAQSLDALAELLRQAGLGEEAIDDLIDAIRRLNQTPINQITTGPGGKSIGNVRAFDAGGVVPGPRGSPQLILAHGGETVLPTHKGPVSVAGVSPSGVAGGPTPIVIQIDGQTLMNALAPVAQRYTNRTGRAVFG